MVDSDARWTGGFVAPGQNLSEESSDSAFTSGVKHRDCEERYVILDERMIAVNVDECK